VTDALAELSDWLRPGIDACRARGRPCVVAITGSVAVGKSTIATSVGHALGETDGAPRVVVVSTDGFLFPNRVLEERGQWMHKGFPETYDRDALLAFLAALKAGTREIRVPLYSHDDYDVTGDYELALGDVVVLEGLHLVGLSRDIDFAVYVDADEADIERWFLERFRRLTSSGHTFYRQFASFTDAQLDQFARTVWMDINAVNLHEYILPTRDHADAVLEKASDHSVRRAWRPRDTMNAPNAHEGE
jgi:type I pantothenate kinase